MNTVILNGGLGNQLFQTAAVLYQSEGKEVMLDQNLGRPRLNDEDQADIAGLLSNSRIKLVPRKPPGTIMRKMSTLAIRESAKTREGVFAIWTVEILASVLFSLFHLSPVRVRINNGIGYDKVFEKKSSALQIGYFQTYEWASRPDVFETLMQLKPLQYSKELQKFADAGKTSKRLCVHVRLTDYRLENSFGIPSFKYYKEAIGLAIESSNFDRITLFSDEPNSALQFIPTSYRRLVEIVPDFPGGVVETFEAMRLCDGYVIGNSTFGWWAAFLSRTKFSIVVAPSVWFRTGPSPVRLIPKHWKRLDPCFT